MQLHILIAVLPTVVSALSLGERTEAGPSPPSRIIDARQAVVTPPPCVAMVPEPTEEETEARFDRFANAFLVTKNLTEAFEYISSTYIVSHLVPGSITPKYATRICDDIELF